MLKKFVITLCLLVLGIGIVDAQNATPQSAPKDPGDRAAAPPKPSPADASQPVNVRLELTIVDQTGPGEPSRKMVTMNVADRFNASIRTSGWVLTKEGRRDVSINVDVRPMVLRNRDGAVQLELGLSYQPTGLAATGNVASAAEAGSAQTGLNERIVTILENGKPLVVSQASDPSLDRRISVEVKATILK